MRFDATASMRCWGLTVAIGGHDYAIPPLPAGPWLTAITAPGYRRIVPGLVVGLPLDDLLDEMVAGRVRASELDEVARDAIGEISGMQWWSAARLSGWLVGHWESLGSAVLARGLKMDRDPLGAVLAVTYRVILENCRDEQERQKVGMELDHAPRGVTVEQRYNQVEAARSFMALAGVAD